MCNARDEASYQCVDDLVPSEFLFCDGLAYSEEHSSEELWGKAEVNSMVAQRHGENHVSCEAEDQTERQCESAGSQQPLFVSLEELAESEGRRNQEPREKNSEKLT